MAGSDPALVLDELQQRLEAAWRVRPRRRGWRRMGLRPAIAIGVLATALVPTALATRDTFWAPSPSPLPARTRPPQAVAGSVSGQFYIAGGTLSGARWRLSASACRYGSLHAIGLFLDVPGGGGGGRCDVASRAPGAGATPAALAARRVYAYLDPLSGATWAFGVLPPSARSVEVSFSSVGADGRGKISVLLAAAQAGDPPALTRGNLPAGLRVFVVSRRAGGEIRGVSARDAAGRVVLHCRAERCDG